MTDGTLSPGEAFTALADSLGYIIETVAGYKRRALEAGFDLDTAETMAEECHTEMVAYYFTILTAGVCP